MNEWAMYKAAVDEWMWRLTSMTLFVGEERGEKV